MPAVVEIRPPDDGVGLVNEEAMKQAVHELGTAIAWLAHGSVHELGTDLAGQIIAKCERASELMNGADD